MSRKRRAAVFSAKCATCCGYRPHQIVVTNVSRTLRTRRLFCAVCDTSQLFGLCCPECRGCRFDTIFTRHAPGGITFRVKECRHCGHRIRAREVFERSVTV